jgi:hypothetical protein
MFMTNTPPPKKFVFFNEGDTVRLKLPDSPLMMVKEIVKNEDATRSRERLKGIRCCWFNMGQEYICEVFNTKDIEHVEAVAKVDVTPHVFRETGQV